MARPVARRAPSMVASHAAKPIVKAGKMMWKLIRNANWRRDRKTGSSSMSEAPSLARAVEADLGGDDFRWPGDVRKAGRHRNPLRPVRCTGDNAATVRAAEVPAPELLA